MSCGTVGMKFLPEQIVPFSDICWLSNLFLPSVHKHGNTAEFSPLIWAMNPQVPKEIHWLLCYSNKWNLFLSISGFLLKHLRWEKLLESFFGLLINKKTATKIKKKATLGAPSTQKFLSVTKLEHNFFSMCWDDFIMGICIHLTWKWRISRCFIRMWLLNDWCDRDTWSNPNILMQLCFVISQTELLPLIAGT